MRWLAARLIRGNSGIGEMQGKWWSLGARWACGLGLIGVLLGFLVGGNPFLRPAEAQVMGEIIGPGATSYPIAVPPLLEIGGRRDDSAERFADVLAHDLQLSGYFHVLDRKAYIDDPQNSPTTGDEIEFHNWSVIGALALVKGTLERTAEGVVVELRLFDVPGRKQMAGKRYKGPAHELSRIAHRFADEVLLVFTGVRGPFDSLITFVSSRAGKMKELYLMSFDAKAPTRLTTHKSIVVSPTWNNDARGILFTSYRGGRPGLYELDVLGGRSRYIGGAGPLAMAGAWAPNGSRMAVTLEIGGNPEIVLLFPDGRIAQRVTRNPAIDVSPSWSPDGREIAFCSDRAGGPQIFVAEVQTGTVRRITYRGSYNTSPAWSPSRDEIAYTSRVRGRFQIALVDTKGGEPKMITNDPGNNEDPAWSPDGRYLAFASTRTGRSHIFMVDRLGRTRKQLTHGEGNDSSPSWSPRLE